jgi:hypothetical protein
MGYWWHPKYTCYWWSNQGKRENSFDYEQKEFLAQHLILSSTPLCLSQKILGLTSAKDMWEAVKLDATTKSSLQQVDILNHLQSALHQLMWKLTCSKWRNILKRWQNITNIQEWQAHQSWIPDSRYIRIWCWSFRDAACSRVVRESWFWWVQTCSVRLCYMSAVYMF